MGSQLATDNMQQIDQYINFHDFDLNNDGHIDAMFMVHAGADGADDGNTSHCWSHAIPYFNYMTNDGVVIDGVTNVPEFAMVTPNYDTTMCCIAVMCHEMGHLVGLPDLYDGTRYSWGVGYWGLMGYGAWGAGGNTPWSPSHMEAWSKVQAGFVTPVVISNDTHNLRIVDVETHPVVYKTWRNGLNRDTCFYLENRQQKGFDAPLPGPGLLIWHIDPGRGAWHNIVDLEEDSTYHLDYGNGVRPNPHFYNQLLGDTSDPLPGNWNRTVFDNYTIPNSRATNGTPTNVGVRNIHLFGDTIICDITFSPQDIEEKPALPISQIKISARPNPFSKSINIKIEAGEKNNSRRIAIYSISGEQVYNVKLSGNNNFKWSGTDKSGRLLPNGIYFVRVVDENLSNNQKIIIQR
jgi:immune inhibitor A